MAAFFCAANHELIQRHWLDEWTQVIISGRNYEEDLSEALQRIQQLVHEICRAARSALNRREYKNLAQRNALGAIIHHAVQAALAKMFV